MMQPNIEQYSFDTTPTDQYDSPRQISMKTIVALVIVVILLLVASMARSIILGSAQAVSLQSAQPLSGVVSQALGPNADGSLPVVGQDFKLSVQYFDNNDWAVGSIAPLKNNFEASLTVLKKNDGIYTVVLDPTNSLPSGQLQGLPSDVSSYVRSHVAVYQPVANQ